MTIAFDASSGTLGASVTSLTVSHTCTGSNLVLIAGLYLASGDNVSSVTYNGVAMTQAIKVNRTGTEYIYLYYLANPATGANNLVANFSSDATPALEGVSFSGAKTTGIPDSSASATGGTSPISVSTTTVADNSISVLLARNGSGPYTASTNSTLANDQSHTALFYSSSVKTPPGSANMQVTYTGGATWAGVMLSLAPFTVQNLTLTASSGSFSITGFSALLGRSYTLVASVGSFLITGFNTLLNYSGWTNQTKNTSTFSNQSKSSSSWTNRTKH